MKCISVTWCREKQKINYKLKKSVEKPEKDWVKVENTHEPIISEDVFLVVQNLLKVDGRVSPVSEKNSFFHRNIVLWGFGKNSGQ